MLKAKEAFFLLLYLCFISYGSSNSLKDSPDPLLSLIFNTPDASSQQTDTRPDRSLAGEEEAKQTEGSHVKLSTERRSAETAQQGGLEELMSLVPSSSNAPSSDSADFMSLPSTNAIPADAPIPQATNAQFAPLGLSDIGGVLAEGKRDTLMQPDSYQQQSLGPVDSNLDKKSSVPAAPVLTSESYSLQLNKVSPNADIHGVPQHVTEFGETVDSVKSVVMAKKSDIPKPDESNEKSSSAVKSTIPDPSSSSADNLMSSNNVPQTEEAVKKSTIPEPAAINTAHAPSPVAYFEIQQNQQNAYVTGPHYDVAQMQPLQAPQPQAFAPAPFQFPQQPVAEQQQRQIMPAPIMDQSHAQPLPSNQDEPCGDQYATCEDFAKNKYCENYPDLMKIQCRRSCKYCVPKVVPQPPAAPIIETKPASVKEAIAESGDSSGSGSGDDSQEASGDTRHEVSAAQSHSNKTGVQAPSRKNTVETTTTSPESGSGEEVASGSEGSGLAQSAAVKSPSVTQVTNAKFAAPVVEKVASSTNTQQQQVKVNKVAEGGKKTNVPDELSGESGSGVGRSSIPNADAAASEVVSGESEGSGSSEVQASEESGASSGVSKSTPTDKEESNVKKDTIQKPPNGSTKKTKMPKKEKTSTKTKSDNVKKSMIPMPGDAKDPHSPYPRIDLKQIASALARYEQAALELAGEYPTSLESDYTRSSIPHADNIDVGRLNKMKQNVQVAKIITQENHKRYDIPKYLLVGEKIHEKGGFVESNVVTADSVQSVEERFKIPGVVPNLNDYYAETGKTSFGDSNASKKSKINNKKKKKIQKPIDPYEYLRNMAPGASMEPIVDLHAKSTIAESHSYPIYLMKVMPGSHKYTEVGPSRSKIGQKPNVKAAAQAVPARSPGQFVPQRPLPIPAAVRAQLQQAPRPKTNEQIVAEQWSNFVARQRQAAAPANQATSDLRSKMLSAFFSSRNAVASDLAMGSGSGGSGMPQNQGYDLNLRDTVLAPAGVQK